MERVHATREPRGLVSVRISYMHYIIPTYYAYRESIGANSGASPDDVMDALRTKKNNS